jgi:hypothetical protein
MLPGPYTIKKQYAGDTFDGLRMTLSRTEDGVTEPIDLTSADVTFHLNFGAKGGEEILNLSSSAGGVSIEDAEQGIFRIDPFAVPETPGNYYFAVRVLFPADVVKTYVEGRMAVVERVR